MTSKESVTKTEVTAAAPRSVFHPIQRDRMVRLVNVMLRAREEGMKQAEVVGLEPGMRLGVSKPSSNVVRRRG